MPRLQRFIPENRDGVLVAVTARTIGARALLTPSPDPIGFNEVIVCVIGRALEVSPVELCACVWLGNHHHHLLVIRDQQQLSRFMKHLNANVSKEIGRIRDWSGPLWHRRYDAIVVSDEPEAQWQQLKYLLSNSVKEGLVESPLHWPGVHAARSLVHGEPLEGKWFNRSKHWAARQRGLEVNPNDFATRYEVHLAPLPAFRHLSPETYRGKVAELLSEIEAEGEAKRAGDPVAGAERIQSQNPYEPPTRRPKRSPRPLFHAASREAHKALRKELTAYLAQYRIASEALRRGRKFEAASWFPEGSYPPLASFRRPEATASPAVSANPAVQDH